MNKSHIFGYLLGLLIFVIGIPALMWLVSGRPWPYVPDSAVLCTVSLILAVCGLTLSIYSIVYMRIVGKGNPFDAYGHELAPRTKRLMTSGPYRLCRNPMLVGIYIYDAGVLVWLWSVMPLIIVLAEVILLTLQVRSEEKRLEKDFGQEYLVQPCRHLLVLLEMRLHDDELRTQPLGNLNEFFAYFASMLITPS